MTDATAEMMNGSAPATEERTLTVTEAEMVEVARELVTNTLSRMQLAATVGKTHEGTRDLYKTLGWKKVITATDLWAMYLRGGWPGALLT